MLDDPDDLWGTIKKMGLCKLYDAFRGKCRAGKCSRCNNNHELIKTGNPGISRHKMLHKFTDQAAKKVWKIPQNITRHYDGDARDIWKGRSPEDVQSRLCSIGFGDNTSHMVVDGLLKSRHIEGRGRLNASRHIRRVLGRVFTADMVTAEGAHCIAETVRPGNTWGPLTGRCLEWGRESAMPANRAVPAF